jgi:hypothetical protein
MLIQHLFRLCKTLSVPHNPPAPKPLVCLASASAVSHVMCLHTYWGDLQTALRCTRLEKPLALATKQLRLSTDFQLLHILYSWYKTVTPCPADTGQARQATAFRAHNKTHAQALGTRYASTALLKVGAPRAFCRHTLAFKAAQGSDPQGETRAKEPAASNKKTQASRDWQGRCGCVGGCVSTACTKGAHTRHVCRAMHTAASTGVCVTA